MTKMIPKENTAVLHIKHILPILPKHTCFYTIITYHTFKGEDHLCAVRGRSGVGSQETTSIAISPGRKVL
jgi:hypothetical protein